MIDQGETHEYPRTMTPHNVSNLKARIQIGLLLAATVAASGCKPKEQSKVISNKVVNEGQAIIHGQMFIVTAGRANVVLGDEEVALVDEQKLLGYFNSKMVEWTNALAAAQTRIDQASAAYSALFKEEIEKLSKTKNWHDERMARVSTSSPEWAESFEWSQKLKNRLRALYKSRKSSDTRKQLDDAIREQARLFDEIKFPKPDSLGEGRIESATADSDGRFKFVVPADSKNLMLVAKSERKTADGEEKYWWLQGVYLNITTEVILSNHNAETRIGWMYLVKEGTPFSNYIEDYSVRMAKAEIARNIEALDNEDPED